MHSRQWLFKTTRKNRAYLNNLVEYFGPDRLLATTTWQDASEVNRVLQALPACRNTKLNSKAMPLLQVTKEPCHKTMTSHTHMFKTFFG